MRFIALFMAAVVAIAFSGNVHARKAPLVDPAPISVPANLKDAQIAKEIKRALVQRGWEATDVAPGQIDGTLHLREHMAKIRIDYNATEVRVQYVDSKNLDFAEKKGGRVIHPNYLGWIQFLTSDIKANLGVAALDNNE